jgi:hypothetical protein
MNNMQLIANENECGLPPILAGNTTLDVRKRVAAKRRSSCVSRGLDRERTHVVDWQAERYGETLNRRIYSLSSFTISRHGCRKDL